MLEDMIQKGRKAIGPFGETHPKTKLTNEMVIGIRQATGTLYDIGEKFGVSVSTVHNIRTHKTWKHI